MLQGRVALVTGSAQGIGAAIAQGLSEAGAKVAIGDLNGDRAAERAAAITAATGNPTMAVAMDVSDSANVASAVAKVAAELGPIDVLVNNAGIDVIKLFIESTEDEWDRVIAVNLKGTIICCRAVIDSMIERGGGRIVCIASDAGRVGSSTEAVYSATKGGVIAFTKTLARELARYQINVNCVCPGPTDTSLFAQVGEYNAKIADATAKAIPLKRIAQPNEIAPRWCSSPPTVPATSPVRRCRFPAA